MLVRYRTPALDRNVDRIFRQMTSDLVDRNRTLGPAVHGNWDDDGYVVTVDLPGIPAEGVAVEVASRTLAISASHDGTEWQRALKLPNRLDPEQVSARHLDGRLTVRIGMVDEPEARSIEISTDEPAIEATSTTDADPEADQIDTSSSD